MTMRVPTLNDRVAKVDRYSASQLLLPTCRRCGSGRLKNVPIVCSLGDTWKDEEKSGRRWDYTLCVGSFRPSKVRQFKLSIEDGAFRPTAAVFRPPVNWATWASALDKKPSSRLNKQSMQFRRAIVVLVNISWFVILPSRVVCFPTHWSLLCFQEDPRLRKRNVLFEMNQVHLTKQKLVTSDDCCDRFGILIW